MSEDEIEKHLSNIKNSVLPDKQVIIRLIGEFSKIMQQEPNLIYIDGFAYVFGDIHGQFYDLINMMKDLNDDYKFVFLGDYVDRGYNSVEVMVLLMLLKLQKPSKIFLMRGNHENKAQTSAYGFKEECCKKYDEIVYWKFCEAFLLFPIAVVINKKYFCIHGGIRPDLSLDSLINANRIEEFPDIGDVLWGDPSDEVLFFKQSQRGAGFLYGAKAVEEFLNEIHCNYLVRSHQLVFEGYQEHFGGKCITVWSAPNYCYKCKNKASIMIIGNEKHDFLLFNAVEEQFKAKDLEILNFL